MNQGVRFECEGEMAARAVAQALTPRGFQVVRSFELSAALAVHVDCECPHHGTARCTCQFVVLLIYGEAGAPVVVTAHSRDAQTQVQLVQDPNTQPDTRLVTPIMAALCEAALTVKGALNCSAEMLPEAHSQAPPPRP